MKNFHRSAHVRGHLLMLQTDQPRRSQQHLPHQEQNKLRRHNDKKEPQLHSFRLPHNRLTRDTYQTSLYASTRSLSTLQIHSYKQGSNATRHHYSSTTSISLFLFFPAVAQLPWLAQQLSLTSSLSKAAKR